MSKGVMLNHFITLHYKVLIKKDYQPISLEKLQSLKRLAVLQSFPVFGHVM